MVKSLLFTAALLASAAHGDNEHGQEYGLAVQMIELHAKLWTPAVAETVTA